MLMLGATAANLINPDEGGTPPRSVLHMLTENAMQFILPALVPYAMPPDQLVMIQHFPEPPERPPTP